jgi:hypothetical protein
MTAGCAYFAVGRGAAITGRGAHLLLIDDQLKDAEEANSATIRRTLRQWFSTVAFNLQNFELISKKPVDKPPAIWCICFIALLP